MASGSPGGLGTGAAPIDPSVWTDESDTLVNLAGSLLARTRGDITEWIPNGEGAYSTGFGSGTVTVRFVLEEPTPAVEMHVFAPDGGLVADVTSVDLNPDQGRILRLLFETIRRKARNADSVVNGILYELGSPWGAVDPEVEVAVDPEREAGPEALD